MTLKQMAEAPLRYHAKRAMIELWACLFAAFKEATTAFCQVVVALLIYALLPIALPFAALYRRHGWRKQYARALAQEKRDRLNEVWDHIN